MSYRLGVALLIVLCSAIVTGLFFISQALQLLGVPVYTFGSTDHALAGENEAVGSVFFVGDILLARNVERLMELHGTAYPFKRIKELTEMAAVSVGNFEASVPKVHEPTDDFEMRFSVRQRYLATLHEYAGFDVLSLANNHALDYGTDGYAHTIRSCSFYTLTCIGHPEHIDHTSVYYRDFGTTRVGILALNATQSIDQIALGVILGKMEFYSDIQFVFIHWGTEYETKHNTQQEALAHTLIDNGIDAIFGHHPHVLQDISFYKGSPIFYSLGNFVFDQYFDKSVQTGLAVSVQIFPDTLEYTLLGVTSIDAKSSPRNMSRREKSILLQALRITSDDTDLSNDVRDGVFSQQRS